MRRLFFLHNKHPSPSFASWSALTAPPRCFSRDHDMAHLTHEECDKITEYPLSDSLNAVRDALYEAEQKTSSEASQFDDSTDVPERPRLFAAAMSKLLSTLSESELSLSLASRTGRDSLLVDLAVIRSRLQKGNFTYKEFRPLSQLVVKQASDVDIWTAVIALVRTISHHTPPPSQPSSFDTPVTHSSASLQGSEQSRKRLEFRVFEEIRDCTHRAVEGFHEKYFEGKSWSTRMEKAWKSAQKHYSDNDKKWTRFPHTPNEDEVCTWWLTLEGNLLAKERATYFRSTADNKVGTEARRQLDLLVKMKGIETTDARHDWKDVLVVGELKKSEERSKGLLLQIGSAVRNVFANQPTRRFVHSFTLTGTEMETWVFDRSGPYSADVFDIHKEPKRFFQVMCGYLMMSDEELGIDTFIKRKDDGLSVALPTGSPRGKKRKFELDPDPIASQRAIVCRGTSCYLSKPIDADEYGSVVKISWTSDMRPPEADLLKKANDRGVKGLAVLVGYQDEVTSISSLRSGLVFSTPHKFRGVLRSACTSLSQSQAPLSHSFGQFPGLSITSNGSRKRKSANAGSQSSKRSRSNNQVIDAEHGENKVVYVVQDPQGTSLIEQDQAPYANRILRVLAISPAGRCISQFKSAAELLGSLRDAVQVHRSLFMDGKILHRDISENNIIIINPEKADGFRGMLIDLDLAKEDGKGSSGARHRTGTMEFMAIEVLQGISHTYRHDLEAFFYVLIWLCARRGWTISTQRRNQPKNSLLSRWYTGSYKDIAQGKRGDMDRGGLKELLAEFPPEFDCVKPLCRTLRDILFPYRDGLFTGTPEDPEILYGPFIKTFDDVLVEVRRQESKTS